MGIKYLVSSNRGIMKSKRGFERELLMRIKHALSMDKRKSSIEVSVPLES
jgi:hypothetical protein